MKILLTLTLLLNLSETTFAAEETKNIVISDTAYGESFQHYLKNEPLTKKEKFQTDQAAIIEAQDNLKHQLNAYCTDKRQGTPAQNICITESGIHPTPEAYEGSEGLMRYDVKAKVSGKVYCIISASDVRLGDEVGGKNFTQCKHKIKNEYK